MKRVLIVSPHFPPTNAPDQQRVRTSLPYFSENGWVPEVLAVAANSVAATQDPLQAEILPPEVLVQRVSALPLGVTRWAGLGNIGYRSWLQLRSRGTALLRSGRFDLVYFSTTQFIATTLGRQWQAITGVPFVIDIQDPWRTDYYERPGAPRPPGGWKYRFARAQAERLEEKSWQPAAGFVSVSQDYLDQLAARYHWFVNKPAAVVPFGAPAADFDFVRRRNDLGAAFRREPGAIHVVSVGAIGPIMRASLATLFRGVQALRAKDPVTAARLRFHFIGTSYAAGNRATPSVQPLAEEMGVGDLVTEQVNRIGYFDAIRTMIAADAIFVPGSDDVGYRPSKMAVCALAAKPVLAIGLAGSAFNAHARELGFSFAETGRASAEEMPGLLRQLTDQTMPLPQMPAAYTVRATTAQQCELFARALACSPTSRAITSPLS